MILILLPMLLTVSGCGSVTFLRQVGPSTTPISTTSPAASPSAPLAVSPMQSPAPTPALSLGQGARVVSLLGTTGSGEADITTTLQQISFTLSARGLPAADTDTYTAWLLQIQPYTTYMLGELQLNPEHTEYHLTQSMPVLPAAFTRIVIVHDRPQAGYSATKVALEGKL